MITINPYQSVTFVVYSDNKSLTPRNSEGYWEPCPLFPFNFSQWRFVPALSYKNMLGIELKFDNTQFDLPFIMYVSSATAMLKRNGLTLPTKGGLNIRIEQTSNLLEIVRYFYPVILATHGKAYKTRVLRKDMDMFSNDNDLFSPVFNVGSQIQIELSAWRGAEHLEAMLFALVAIYEYSVYYDVKILNAGIEADIFDPDSDPAEVLARFEKLVEIMRDKEYQLVDVSHDDVISALGEHIADWLEKGKHDLSQSTLDNLQQVIDDGYVSA